MLTGLGAFFVALGAFMRHWAMTRGSIGLGPEDDERLRFGAVLKWLGPVIAIFGGALSVIGLVL